jgi:hypothetical protein
MDEDLRNEIRQAKALDDEARRICGEWQARRHEIVRKSIDQDLVYKVHENLPPVLREPPSQDESDDDLVTMGAMEVVVEEHSKLAKRISVLEAEMKALRKKLNNVKSLRGRDAAR